jgi:ADP-heptose:LPS heptosyltransferase
MRSPELVVLRALGLGDLLTGLPAIRALAEARDGRRLVLATTPAVAPLARLCRVADDVVPARPLRPLFPHIGHPDLAVNLHGAGPRSHEVLLETRPRRLVAFAHPDVPESQGQPAWRSGEHEVQRWCRLLQQSAIPADPDRLHLPVPDVKLPAHWTAATVIHPGAADPARRWPTSRFAGIARLERRRGRTVLITGTPAERPLALDLAGRAGLPPDAVVAGNTDLVTLAALVSAAGRVICGDTGVAHLATAYGTPSVVLFGPVSPAEWGPPPDRLQHRVLWAGRVGDPHGEVPDPGLLAITVADVVSQLDCLDQLGRRRAS